MKPGGPEAAALPLAERAAAAPWRVTGAALAVLLPALVWLYRDTAAAIESIWSRSDTFSHAYLVLPIVAWLIWRQRDALALQMPRAAPWLLLPVALAAATWLLGELAAVNSVTQLAFVALLVLGFVAIAGLRVARTLLFPLCFLFFAVPIGEFLLPTLMSWTADFTVLALRLSGIPVYREGQQFMIPSGAWSVIEACSGVRYLIASFMVGTLYAYLNYRSLRRRLAFAALSLAVPIVANWLRAYGIVMLGHLSSNQLAVGTDHLIYGWVFFGVVIWVMYAIGARWAEPDVPLATVSVGKSMNLAAASAGLADAGDRAARQRRATWLAGSAALVLAALPQAALRYADDPVNGAEQPPLLSTPQLLGDGSQLARDGLVWQPAFENPSAALSATYRARGREVGVYVGYYRRQTRDRKLVSSNNVLVRTQDPVWATLAEGSRTVTVAPAPGAPASGSGEEITWRTALLRGTSTPAAAVPERLRVWQLYWVNGRFTASDVQAKALGAVQRLLGRGDDAAVVVLYVPDAEVPLPAQAGADTAESVLAGFAAANLPAIDALLRRTRDAAALQPSPAAAEGTGK